MARLSQALLIAAVMCVPSLADAQNMPAACGDYDTAMAELQAKYGEVTVMRGLGADGHMVEITKNDDGAFSIMITNPRNGVTCMVYAGEAMDFVEAPKPGEAM